MDADINDLMLFAEHALQAQSNSEHKNQYLRTSLHKAYYAAYNTCKPIASKLPKPERKSGVHQTVINTFKQAGRTYNLDQNNQLKLLAMLLQQAKEERTLADYKLNIPVNEPQVQAQLTKAKDIIELSKAIDGFVTPH